MTKSSETMIAAAEPSEVGPVNTFDVFKMAQKFVDLLKKTMMSLYELLRNIQIFKKNKKITSENILEKQQQTCKQISF